MQDKAIELRKAGKSYRSIQKELGVSLSTLSHWFAPLPWSQEIGSKLKKESSRVGTARLAASRKAKGFGLQFAYAKAKQDAELEYKKLKKDRLFMAGLVLYWALGDKSSRYYVRLSTADTAKMSVFKHFLEVSLETEATDVRYSLLITPPLYEKRAMELWSVSANIPIQSFTKSTFRRKKGTNPLLPSSICTATVSSRYLKEKMLVWLRLVAQDADMVLGPL